MISPGPPPYADYILVMDALPYPPFHGWKLGKDGWPGCKCSNRGWNYQAVIRGWRSPLYVVDGVPVDAGAVNAIGPNDVATIEVHKGLGHQSVWKARKQGGDCGEHEAGVTHGDNAPLRTAYG